MSAGKIVAARLVALQEGTSPAAGMPSSPTPDPAPLPSPLRSPETIPALRPLAL